MTYLPLQSQSTRNLIVKIYMVSLQTLQELLNEIDVFNSSCINEKDMIKPSDVEKATMLDGIIKYSFSKLKEEATKKLIDIE